MLKPLTDESNTNYNLLKTSSTPLRRYKYLTTTNWCLLMWNHCLPAFHFNWLYSVLRPPSNAPIPNYIPTQDIMELLTLCLKSTYFQYNGKHCKQLHGTAMGSPVSVIVAEIVMQAIEERVIATDLVMLHWRHFHYRAPRSDEINTVHEHLNEQNPDIQFTKEIEENLKLPFLDCLVIRENNKIRTTVYRKPTHTDRIHDQSSYNPTRTKLQPSRHWQDEHN